VIHRSSGSADHMASRRKASRSPRKVTLLPSSKGGVTVLRVSRLQWRFRINF
jgi:hypothetical protein